MSAGENVLRPTEISHLTECDIVQLAISLGEQRLRVDDTSAPDVTEVDDVYEVVG